MDITKRILIVDDDAGLRRLISSFLDKHGFTTETAANPIEMRERLAQDPYDLIVLDVMMPREDGLSALRSLQQDAPPVIMLSAVGTDIDRIVGLEMGAEDYLAKPCNPRELLARIRTVLRRRQKEEGGPSPSQSANGGEARRGLAFAGWRIDFDGRMLYDPDDQVISLTDGEFRLLRAFVEHPRRVLTRDQLLDYARGEDSEHYDRAIDVQISRLRRKLGEGRQGAELVRTVRNEGYLFVPSVTKA
ncbi:response regulator [Sphingomonas nostoxanthinifaciens]|uniref:response regulator n=1 Tax=Sphingomonas nostoxanthinifaciens TaxID=2872652 RepID=UPI001CC1DF7C|nr:response regulator [Sphingomonas nostoxanthinifaciens]UAK26687.1 response regulator [Sphingomonas nostoxanthinifaciens]